MTYDKNNIQTMTMQGLGVYRKGDFKISYKLARQFLQGRSSKFKLNRFFELFLAVNFEMT